MQLSEHILLKAEGIEASFEWGAFDGDDCFNDFHIVVTSNSQQFRYEFGSCAIYGLRKWTKFFEDAAKQTVSLGFRNPNIRCCDLDRTDNGYKLRVKFEESSLQAEFEFPHPTVELNRSFLNAYDGPSD